MVLCFAHGDCLHFAFAKSGVNMVHFTASAWEKEICFTLIAWEGEDEVEIFRTECFKGEHSDF